MGRIALVSEHASPLTAPGQLDAGSQNAYVAALSAALCGLGHEVVVYTRRTAPRAPNRVRTQAGYEVVHVHSGPSRKLAEDEATSRVTDFARFLSADWNAKRPDVVHAQGWLSGITAVLGARGRQVPVVQTFHTLGSADRSLAVERLLGKEVAKVVATHSDEANDVLRMGICGSKVSVIPHGVDLKLFTPHGAIAPRERTRRIVAAGQLVPHQGFDDLIRALSTVDDAELVIAGGSATGRLRGDPEARRLRTLARSRGLAHRVTFTGPLRQRELPALLRSADVVACTPRYESFGVNAIEAMACGVPVVVTAVGGLVDAVVDEETGVRVPSQDPRAISQALTALLRDATRRRTLGAAGRERIRARYSWDSVAAELVRVYADVIRPSPEETSAHEPRA
ncbi:glycosyltransferase [Lentzea sp. BCCO 10_0061]|uniref:Glycosyltransferase n=1 Tax=Lentzea sokolovensis TaxID=3095429 RepID=A0ABU4US24_9PSEU|nr:glycosyltransferase [Lentzea sp. BCCO 10_0061]MDX8141829.1 glycosyltransferase [Lentzea sp. BCCO 10_0061]